MPTAEGLDICLHISVCFTEKLSYMTVQRSFTNWPQLMLHRLAHIYYTSTITGSLQQSFDGYANYGAFLHLTGKYTMAEKEYFKALEINPTDNVTRTNLHKLTSAMKDSSTSTAWVDVFVE